jgi:tRNA threonylcarbamoyladenosine biosynthesis protein TsaB
MANDSFDLVVDSSRYGIAMGLYQNNQRFEFFDNKARGESAGHVLDQLLEQANTSLDHVKRVLVTLGPGSFTGLRTGIAFCQGLCFSGKRELYGISTLEALTSLSNNPNNAVIIRARPGYWYLRYQNKEIFDSTEEVVSLLNTMVNADVILDSFALDDAEIKSAIEQKDLKVTLITGTELESFLVFLDQLKPSLIQEANYIQPSYFEKKT